MMRLIVKNKGVLISCLLILSLNSYSQSYAIKISEAKSLSLDSCVLSLKALHQETDLLYYPDTTATIEYLIGRYSNQLGDYESGLKYASKAINSYQSYSYPYYRLFNSINDVIVSAKNLNKPETAYQYFYDMLSLPTMDRFSYYIKAICTQSMSEVYQDNGDYQLSIDLYKDLISSDTYDSLTLNRKAWAHYNLGMAYSFIEKEDYMRDSDFEIRRADELLHQEDEIDRELESLILYQSGYNKMILGDYALAIESFDEYLENRDRFGLSILNVFEAKNSKAYSLLKLRKFNSSLDVLRSIIPLIEGEGISKTSAHKALSNIALAYADIDLDSSQFYFEKALSVLDFNYNSFEAYPIDSLKSDYLPDIIITLVDFSSLLFENHLKGESYRILKYADELMDRLLANMSDHKSVLNWRDKFSGLYDRLVDQSYSFSDDERLWMYMEKSKNLAMLDKILASRDLRAKSLQTYAFDTEKYDPYRIAITQNTALHLLSIDNISTIGYVVNYKVLKDRIVVMLIDPLKKVDKFEFSKEKFHTSSFWKDEFGDMDSLRLGDFNDLYNDIFEPLGIPVGSVVVVIPDGSLANLPFGALLQDSTDAHSFLERDYSISYQLSASLAQQFEQKEVNSEGQGVFAPSFSQNPEEVYASVRGLMSDSLELYHLPEAMNEATFVSSVWYEMPILVSKESIVKSIQENRIFHFSGHAVGYMDNSDLSFLALDCDLENPESKLQLKELYNLECNNEMVVLSACETAIGEYAKGEGVLSLSRGFFYAGAKSVISTLWSINDQSSAFIMKEFYKELKKGKRKDEALRQAKLTYLAQADPEYQHPYYWAAFVAMGDMSPLFDPYKKWKIGGGIFVALLIGGVGYKKYSSIKLAA